MSKFAASGKTVLVTGAAALLAASFAEDAEKILQCAYRRH